MKAAPPAAVTALPPGAPPLVAARNVRKKNGVGTPSGGLPTLESPAKREPATVEGLDALGHLRAQGHPEPADAPPPVRTPAPVVTAQAPRDAAAPAPRAAAREVAKPAKSHRGWLILLLLLAGAAALAFMSTR
jgi:hypothetical protein